MSEARQLRIAPRSKAARRERPRRFNRARLVLDRRLTFANALDRARDSHPDSRAMHLDRPLPYAGLAGDALSVEQIARWVNRTGHALREAGLRRHDRVAVYKTNAPDYLFYSLAISRAGGIAVPVHPSMPVEILRRYLEHTGARMLVTDVETFDRSIREPAALPDLSRWVFPRAPSGFGGEALDLASALPSMPEELEPLPVHPDAPAVLFHTSGTTGVPKAVISTHQSLIGAVKAHYKAEWFAPRSTRLAFALPWNHLIGQVTSLTLLLANQNQWCVTHSEGKSVLALLDRERIEVFIAFPNVYLSLYEAGLDRYALDSMRLWVGVADATHEAHMKAFTRKGAALRLFGVPLLRSVFMDPLGSTEVGFTCVSRFFLPFSRPRLSRMVGRQSLVGPRAKVADAEGRRLPPGRVGRFMVKGRTVFAGYWNAHDRLLGVTGSGWWATGDVGYRDRLGRFYHLDREVDVVRTAAGPVYSLPVEEVLMMQPEVSEASVIGVPHPREGTVPVAVVAPAAETEVDAEELARRVSEAGALRYPLRKVVLVDREDIPLGLTGKVLKRNLRERYADLFQAAVGAGAS